MPGEGLHISIAIGGQRAATDSVVIITKRTRRGAAIVTLVARSLVYGRAIGVSRYVRRTASKP